MTEVRIRKVVNGFVIDTEDSGTHVAIDARYGGGCNHFTDSGTHVAIDIDGVIQVIRDLHAAPLRAPQMTGSQMPSGER